MAHGNTGTPPQPQKGYKFSHDPRYGTPTKKAKLPNTKMPRQMGDGSTER